MSLMRTPGLIARAAAVAAVCFVPATAERAADELAGPAELRVYDHILIVIDENKHFDQILGGRYETPHIPQLAAEGASFERMYGEEHYSQGNYFWLFSGSNQNV